MTICIRPRHLPCKPGGSQGFALLSDLHIGAAVTDHEAIVADLELARRHGDRILISGDVFEAITPRDVRYRPSGIHPRLQGRDDILDAAVEWAEELLSPYADLIDMIGEGNHETKITEKYGCDLNRQLLHRLNQYASHTIRPGGYQGWVVYRFAGNRRVVKIAYWHGSGGGSSRSSCVKALEQMMDVMVGGTIYATGHRHHRLALDYSHVHCLTNGKVETHGVMAVMSGSYMRSYAGTTGNYVSDKLLAPGGIGGVRVVATFHPDLSYTLKAHL
jgi:hypothetical protein